MTIEELKALDIKEIKVLAYDAMVRIEQERNALNIINQVIAEKSNVKMPELSKA